MTDENKTKEIDNWARESLKILKDYGYVNNGKKIMLIALLWILSLSVFYFAGTQDFFKSVVSQNVSLEPQINTTNYFSFGTPIENSYDFSPRNNFSIYNNIIITENLCN